MVKLLKPTLNSKIILHTFIPPPTEPEHAPMKAINTIKSGADTPISESGPFVKPVVVTIDML